MDPRVLVLVAAAQLDRASYYDILRVPRGVDRATLQKAWHRFALAYHPDRHVDDEPEIRSAATKVYERGVEAYTVLRDEKAAAAYDQALSLGHNRLPPSEFERLSREARKPPPAPTRSSRSRRPPPSELTFVDQMQTAEGREIAARVEKLVQQQRYQDAYVQIGLLETVEPGNPAVRVRADKIGRFLKRRPR
jgi:DnaJ-class molecular chaperone